MESRKSSYLCFRYDPPDEEGTETLTFIVGGRHIGGMSEGRLTWAGGFSGPVASAIAQRVGRWVDDEVTQPCLPGFGDIWAIPDPPER